ncbi:hypothetical protein AVEN_101800-1 [Araneus ventricosus]|uniref:Uncharacterized protein n=1 Tax=Araneus ventricosus TaxID=182803 RepID=A0A4Y2D1A0_ARAVE|nr:hypothetical protein AVEN_101800-1 [Araneus ventricosus]
MVHLNDSRCDSSRGEAGVLMAITGYGLTPPVGGTHFHRQRTSPNHYCTHLGNESANISDYFSFTFSWCPPTTGLERKEGTHKPMYLGPFLELPRTAWEDSVIMHFSNQRNCLLCLAKMKGVN